MSSTVDDIARRGAPLLDPSPRTGGGTLRLAGATDVDHLDPVSAYHAPARQIVRLFARQLLTYPPQADTRSWQAIEPVPDLAADVPSTYNTGLGASHRCYIIHLRPGVFWDTDPPREVTAHDAVRGFKRMCNPVTQSPACCYFTRTVRGMAEYRAAFADAVPRELTTAAALTAFQNEHDIPGVFALDDETLVVELIRPSLDFPHILTMTCASPAPVEYDAFVPDSPDLRRNLRSNGPYRLMYHAPGDGLRLERNDAWRAESDPVRTRRVDAIDVTLEGADRARLQHGIRSGTVDLVWGPASLAPSRTLPVPAASGLGSSLDPYLVFNFLSPNGGGAVRAVGVRRAIAAAIDKAALARVVADVGRGAAVEVARSIVPPGNEGHHPDLAAGNADQDGSDADGARALLESAGVPDGVVLTGVHLDTDVHCAVARSCAADLARAGIDLRLVALSAADYHGLLRDDRRAATGAWDVAVAARSPDWFHTNARVFLQAMFQTGDSAGTANYGHYSDAAVDELVERAAASMEEPGRADAAWHEVERRILEDVAVVPLLFQAPPPPPAVGARVRGAMVVPALDHAYDLAAVWLADAD